MTPHEEDAEAANERTRLHTSVVRASIFCELAREVVEKARRSLQSTWWDDKFLPEGYGNRVLLDEAYDCEKRVEGIIRDLEETRRTLDLLAVKCDDLVAGNSSVSGQHTHSSLLKGTLHDERRD